MVIQECDALCRAIPRLLYYPGPMKHIFDDAKYDVIQNDGFGSGSFQTNHPYIVRGPRTPNDRPVSPPGQLPA